MSIQVLQSSFTGGEVGKSMWSRTDNAKYASSVRKLENYLIYPHGRIEPRGGWQFGLETKYSTTKKARIIKFEFSRTQTYHLEFGDQYIRVHKDFGIVTETAKNISDITNGNPAVVTATSHGYSDGDYVIITGVTGMPRINTYQYKVANKTTHTFELTDTEDNDIDARSFGAYVSGGTVSKIYEISSPYLEADLPMLWVEAQSFDTLSIFHPNYDERTLTRTAHTSWTLATITFGASIAAPVLSGAGSGLKNYCVTAVAANGEESVKSNTVIDSVGGTLTWSAVSGASYYNLYDVVDGFPSFLQKCGNTSATTPNATADQSKGVPTNYSPFNTGNNRPSVGVYHQQRMIRANTITNPFKLWGSQIGRTNNLDSHNPIEASDGFEFTLATTKSNEVKGLVSWKGSVFILTSAYEFLMKQASADQTINATNIGGLDEPISTIGSSYLAPNLVDNAILFLNATRDKVYEMAFDLLQDGYKPEDLSLLAYHMFENRKILSWSVRRQPYSVAMFCRDDGVMPTLTYLKSQQVYGFSRWTTDGYFEDVCTAPSMTGEDQTCAIIRRNINGTERRYVEWYKPAIPSEAIHEAFMVDCGSYYAGTPISTVYGLGYIEGKNVAVMADGVDIPSLKVVDGQVHLPNAASYITIGLPYNADMETLNLDFPVNSGSVQAKPKVINAVIARVEKARRAWIGTTFDNLDPIDFSEDGTRAVPNYYVTGDKLAVADPNLPSDARICFRVTSPLPASLNALLTDTQVSGVKHAAT